MIELVVIGASLGGVEALETILEGLPKEFALPVVVVQHRPSDGGDDGLVDRLARQSAVRVAEAVDKMTLAAGVLLAPADYHVLIDDGAIALSVDPPVSSARPSIDVLFQSAADAFGARVAGLILTGANHDGAAGLADIKRAGGLALVQDPDTTECRSMVDAALAATAVDRVLRLAEIAPFLVELARAGRSRG